MAYETIKNVLGTAAVENLRSRTPTGKADLLGKQLQNRLAAFQLDEQFPRMISKLQKELEFITSEPEKQAMMLRRQAQIEKLKAGFQEGIEKIRGGYDIEQERMRQEGATERAKMTRYTHHTGERVGGGTGKTLSSADAKYNRDIIDTFVSTHWEQLPEDLRITIQKKLVGLDFLSKDERSVAATTEAIKGLSVIEVTELADKIGQPQLIDAWNNLQKYDIQFTGQPNQTVRRTEGSSITVKGQPTKDKWNY